MDKNKKRPEQTKDAHNGFGHYNLLRVEYSRMSDTAFEGSDKARFKKEERQARPANEPDRF